MLSCALLFLVAMSFKYIRNTVWRFNVYYWCTWCVTCHMDRGIHLRIRANILVTISRNRETKATRQNSDRD